MEPITREFWRRGAAFLTVSLMSVMYVRYAWLTATGDIQPRLATWLLSAIAVSISMASYLSHRLETDPGRGKMDGFITNAQNSIDLLGTWLISAAIFFSARADAYFNGFDLVCIGAAVAILVFWRLNRKHAAANLAIQIIMVVAYFPTFYVLWSAGQNTESFVTWGMTWIAAAASVVPAVLDKDKLAVVYSGRAVLLVTLLLLLMLRAAW